MPDLSACERVKLQGWSMVQMLVGDPGVNQKERVYRRILARLVDKAIYEYERAREAVLAELDEQKRPVEQMASKGRELFILAFTDHFENCVNAINRALKLIIEGMKDEPILSAVPEKDREIVKEYRSGLADLRNALEHMEERIRNDEIANGQPIMVCVGAEGDRAVIGKHEVTFANVAEMLCKLHAMGKMLFENVPVGRSSVTTPPPDARTTVIEGTVTMTLRRMGGNDA